MCRCWNWSSQEIKVVGFGLDWVWERKDLQSLMVLTSAGPYFA